MFQVLCAYSELWEWTLSAESKQLIVCFHLSHMPSQLLWLKRRNRSRSQFWCKVFFPFVGKSEQKKWKERSGARKSQRGHMLMIFLDQFWAPQRKAIFFSRLAYCVCSNRAIKSVGILVNEAACDPYHFLLPSSPYLNFKSFPHYSQMLPAGKMINAANCIPLTGELQVLPPERTHKHFLHRATDCFHWTWNGKCGQILQTLLKKRNGKMKNRMFLSISRTAVTLCQAH